MHTHALELHWIHKIHDAIRSYPMDLFFIGWNFVDTIWFSFFLITAVWYLVDRKIGIKLLFILLLSGIVNKISKKAFGLPRPCQIDPTVGVLCPLSHGFPSGAAQTATLLAGILMIECRKKIYWIYGIIFAIFLCFSRIYLGVHYFTDILGGIAIGSVLLLIYWLVFPICEMKWKISLLLFLIFLLLIAPFAGYTYFYEVLGFSLGLYLYEKEKKHPNQKWGVKIAIFLTVIIGLLVLHLGAHTLPKWKNSIYLLMGIWLSYFGQKIILSLRRDH